MSPDNRPNGGKRKPPKKDGRNARERARIAAERAQLRKKRRTIAIAVVAVAAVIIGAGVGFAAWRTYGNPVASGQQGTWPRIDVKVGEPITVGADDAPVTITLWEDFRCPHCKEFEDKLGTTINDLQESGQVKLEYRMVAFIDSQDGMSGSRDSANAFACAATEGFGEQYFNGLFDNYGRAWTNDQLISLANRVADPSARFESCVTGGQYDDWVESNMNQANQDQVTGTPTLMLNGEIQPEAAGWSEQQLRDAVNQAK